MKGNDHYLMWGKIPRSERSDKSYKKLSQNSQHFKSCTSQHWSKHENHLTVTFGDCYIQKEVEVQYRQKCWSLIWNYPLLTGRTKRHWKENSEATTGIILSNLWRYMKEETTSLSDTGLQQVQKDLLSSWNSSMAGNCSRSKIKSDECFGPDRFL